MTASEPSTVTVAGVADGHGARRPWTPLLVGSEAATARELIEAITADLTRFEASASAELDGAGTLAGGRAGLALFDLYRAKAGHPGAAESAVRLLNAGIDAAAVSPGGADLFQGLGGLGFAVAQAASWLAWDPDDLLAGVDSALLTALARPWTGHFDLVSGLVGIGVYGLERLPSSAGAALVTDAVTLLREWAQPARSGLAWLTRPRLLPDHQRASAPAGRHDLGVAHGVAGIIGFLARAALAGISTDMTMDLLDGAVAWLLERECDDPAGRFPTWVIPGVERQPPARAAWCYGDPGVAAVLTLAASVADRPLWRAAAARVGHQAAARPVETSGVVDAGACHGAAGLAHLFARLHQRTGDRPYADGARRWYRRVIEFAAPGLGIGGYRAWRPAQTCEAWHDEPGLLEGAAGIGLVLLAAVTAIEPGWDRMLLLS